MGTERNRIASTKHIIELLNNNPNQEFLKEKLCAEMSIAQGITQTKAMEYIDVLITAEYIQSNGAYIQSINQEVAEPVSDTQTEVLTE